MNGGIIEDSPLFSVSNANDGQFDQLQSFADNANTLFGWEDITRTGNGKLGASDNDFEDLVFSVDAILPIPVDVDIDIKPGSDPSSVNCKNTKGSVPVAIFGSADYDVSTIDLSSLELNEVDVDEVHDKLHMDDINNDGFDDVVLHLDKAGVCNATNENTLKESVGATLTGSTTDDPPVDFTGTGDIRIVKR